MTNTMNNGKKALFFQMVLLSFGGLVLLCLALWFGSAQKVVMPADLQPFGQIESAKDAFEQRAANNIKNVLGKITGLDAVQVSVRAQMDFAKQDTTQEVLDSDNPVILKTSGEDVSYAFSKQIIQKSSQGGVLQKLFVTVLIDNTHHAYSNAQIEQIRSLTAAAVGFDEARGDVLKIEQVPFVAEYVWSKYPFVFVVFLLCLVLSIVWYAMITKLPSKESLTRVRPLEVDFDAAKAELASKADTPIVGQVKANALNQAKKLYQNNPEDTLTALRGWLVEGAREVQQ